MQNVSRKGFTLLEMLMAIALLSALATGILTGASDWLNEMRFEQTVQRMNSIRNALVGDTAVRLGNRRTEFGYLGDVGTLPSAAQGLGALLANPGVPLAAWSPDSLSRIGAGWNGPYLFPSSSGESVLQDGWGRAFVYSPAATPPTFASYGADGLAGGTGFNRDLTIQLPANVLNATVHGFIINGGAQWSGTAEVELNEPDGNGAVRQRLVGVAPIDQGHWSFTGVPLGVRSASVYIPSKATPTRSLGPVLFTVDRAQFVVPPRLLDLRTMFNLEVPIELLDFGIASNNTATAWDRSRSSLDTNDYDGTVTYRFEAICQNQDSSARQVSLVDSSGATKATLGVPGSTAIPTRFTTEWTPTAGVNQYRIQTSGTSLSSQLTCFTARILVQQIGATRTRIYIPLIGAPHNSVTNNNTVSGGAVDSTNVRNSYLQPTPNLYSLWRKDSTRYATLAPGTPWTFEAIVASTAGNPQASLFNKTTNQQVTASQVTGSATLGLASASFADNASNFSQLSDFEVRISRQGGAANNTLYLYKAGLWVKLTSLSKADVYYRITRNFSANSDLILPHSRAFVDLAKFSAPVAYFEAVGLENPVGTSEITLLDHSTQDQGTLAGIAVPGAAINFNSNTRTRQRSGVLPLGSGSRFLPSASVSSGNLIVTSGFVVIEAR